MNPNSGHQRWSKWTFTIGPGGTKRPPFADVRANAARFGRKVFGSASQMRVRVWRDGRVVIEVRTEGHPVHDPAYVASVRALWLRWALVGWGVGTTLQLTTRLEAGSREDGTPPDQLILAPPLCVGGSV